MTDYFIRHVTRFTYPAPVSESAMETRMEPLTEGPQRCLHFALSVQPQARVFTYRDSLGNRVHYFNQPRRHDQLTITARSHVQVATVDPLPAAISPHAWQLMDGWEAQGEQWDFLQPSHFVAWTDSLLAFARMTGLVARGKLDPLSTVREIVATVHRSFQYAPNTTRVDSPIDEVLASRRGVCQDFAHVTLALLRHLHLPSRYVSGYIAPASAATANEDVGATSIATHAWVEVLLPDLGWIGVDPTHNIDTGKRHIRVAIGRDYADVPPTRGVFKGDAASTMAVSVEIAPIDAPDVDVVGHEQSWLLTTRPHADADRHAQAQQQQ